MDYDLHLNEMDHKASALLETFGDFLNRVGGVEVDDGTFIVYLRADLPQAVRVAEFQGTPVRYVEIKD